MITSLQSPPAIVLGTGVVSLGVITDLAAEAVTVIHISQKPNDVALRSRRAAQRIVVGSVADQAARLLAVLLDGPGDWDGACLIPTTDPMVRFVSEHWHELMQRFVTPVQPWERLQHTVNKSRLYEVAAAAGIPTPRILRPQEFDQAAVWARDIGFPVIVKPSETPEFFRQFQVKALEARDEGELLRCLGRVSDIGLDAMVSEVIPGGPTNLQCYRSYVDTHGRTIAELCSQKIRCHPPAYGVGVVHRTIPMVAEIRDYGRRLLAELGFTGFSAMEFKLDPRDGRYRLLEINPRPPQITRLFRAAGLNFVYLTYRAATNQPLPKQSGYEPGVYGIHNTVDLYYLRPYAAQGWRGLKQYVKPYLARRKVFLVPVLSDPAPFAILLWRMISTKIRMVLRSLLPAAAGGQRGSGAGRPA